MIIGYGNSEIDKMWIRTSVVCTSSAPAGVFNTTPVSHFLSVFFIQLLV